MMKSIKIMATVIMGTITGIICMSAILFAGNWVVETLGITPRTAADILSLFLGTCYCVLFVVGLFCFCWSVNRRKKARKDRQIKTKEEADHV